MPDNITFEVSELHFPSIYTPLVVEGGPPKHGAIIPLDESPVALTKWLEEPKWISSLNQPAHRLFSGNRPAVISDRNIDTILSCTDAANLPRDRLLIGIPALVCVSPYRVQSNRLSGGREGPRNLAAVLAIKVCYDDMLRRYDEICAEFFADPTLPYNPGRRRGSDFPE